jgi:hypothetical protein
MPRDQSRRARDRRYAAAVDRQINAIAISEATGRPGIYAPVVDFLRPGDTAEQWTAVCVDDDGTQYDDHDWTDWRERPADMEPATRPHHVRALRWCQRCNRYEARREGSPKRA